MRDPTADLSVGALLLERGDLMNMMSPLFLVLFLSALKVSNKAQLAQTKNYYSAGRPIIRKVSKIIIWVVPPVCLGSR